MNYVHEIVRRCLPDSLAHELKVADFQLRLKSKEDELASRVIEIFQQLSLNSANNPMRVDFINEAFGRFLADSFVDEKELGQYLTPPEVVDFMVRLAAAHLTGEERETLLSADPAQGFGFVLDPSCGVGSFLAEFIRVVHEELVLPNRPELARTWAGRAAADFVVGIDKSERMIRLALANLALFGAPAARLHLSNALATRGDDGAVAQSFTGRVGLILTNPPFGATFGREELAGYELAGSWATRPSATINSELLFLERYATWLCPGG
jgi:type I restriction-modification system DNA methylase subunit